MSWLTAPVPALVPALVFSVFAGVVLPAVWSTRPARRRAASAVAAAQRSGRQRHPPRNPTRVLPNTLEATARSLFRVDLGLLRPDELAHAVRRVGVGVLLERGLGRGRKEQDRVALNDPLCLGLHG